MNHTQYPFQNPISAYISRLVSTSDSLKVIAMGCWLLLFAWMPMWVFIPEAKSQWLFGRIMTVIIVLSWFLSYPVFKFIKRAYLYQLIFAFLIFLPVFLLMVSPYYVIQTASGFGGNNILVLGLSAIVVSVFAMTKNYLFETSASQAELIKCGKLTMKTYEWHPTISVILKGDHERTKKWAWLARLSPLAPALGVYASRNLNDRENFFFPSLMLFILAYTLLFGVSIHLAMGIQLHRWEKEWGRKIYIKQSQDDA